MIQLKCVLAEHTLTLQSYCIEWLHFGLQERPLRSMLLLTCLPDTILQLSICNTMLQYFPADVKPSWRSDFRIAIAM